MLQVILALTVAAFAAIAIRDWRRRPAALRSLAQALRGRVVEVHGWRPHHDVEGTFEGTSLRLSFAGGWMTPLTQTLLARVTVERSISLTIHRRSALRDLEQLGLTDIERASQQSRLAYLFGSLRGSDLVFRDGAAEMRINWPCSARSMAPERVLLPVAEIHALIQVVCRHTH